MTTAKAGACKQPALRLACAFSLATLLGGCTGSLLKSDAEAPETFRLGVVATMAPAATATSSTRILRASSIAATARSISATGCSDSSSSSTIR